MAGVKISALPAVPSALIVDIFPVVQTGVTSKVTLQQLLTLFSSSLLPLAGGTMTGDLILNADPTVALQAATKQYVDNVAAGLEVKASCRVATTSALTVTYNNGSSGVGATLTNAGAMAALAIDGVTLAANDRVLVKDQASSFQNGIYTVTNVGSGATNWVMTRATDYDTPAEVTPGTFVLIDAGTIYASTAWVETATVTAIGVDAINFSRFGSANAITKVITQVFTSSGTYTPSSGLIANIVEAVGGGGGGGGVANCAASTYRLAAGGGAGGYARKTYTAAEIGADAAITIGAAGSAGSNAGGNGGTGGTTTFNPAGSGVTLTANGGVGGTFDSIDRTVLGWGGGTAPGAGGAASNGDINIPGQYGRLSIVVGVTNIVNLITGMGGNGIYGAGGRQNIDGNRDGRNATGFGAGGSGAATVNALGSGTGGAGTAGIVIIHEFCSQ